MRCVCDALHVGVRGQNQDGGSGIKLKELNEIQEILVNEGC